MITNIFDKVFSYSHQFPAEERQFRDYLYNFVLLYNRAFYKLFTYQGETIFRADWDYLLVLDACRFDTFQDVSSIDGDLEKIRSAGSNTLEWLQNNFTDTYDLTYVSANPHVSNSDAVHFDAAGRFSRVEPVWKYGWNDDLGTVPPEVVTEAALQQVQENPSSKMIIHYLQPHAPWITKDGKLSLDGENIAKDIVVEDLEMKTRNLRLWKMAINGELDIDIIRKAYRTNLEYALSSINRLIDYLKGDVVITSDHGEAFGERGLYAHPGKIYTDKLVEVPWLKVSDERVNQKDIDSFTPDLDLTGGDHVSDKEGAEETTKRLEDLGYL